MCNYCYHKYGRRKKPWNCIHDKLYAHGLCQNCYIIYYNQVKIIAFLSNDYFFFISDKKKSKNLIQITQISQKYFNIIYYNIILSFRTY